MAGTLFENNLSPYLTAVEGTTPASPSAGQQRLFVRSSDHVLCLVNSSGTVSALSGNPMTTGGDLIYGGASGVATRLANGAAGQILTSAGGTAAPAWGQGPLTTTGDVLVGATGGTPTRLALGGVGGSVSRLNGVVAWNSGTSNPTGAAGDRYWRSDLNLMIAYNGSQWVTANQYLVPLGIVGGTLPISATAANFQRAPFPYAGIYNFLVERVITSFFVSGGTALDASNKWVGSIADEGSGFYTVTIASGASNAWRKDDSGALTTNEGSTHFDLEATWTKTGTPGSLYMVVGIYGRPIIT